MSAGVFSGPVSTASGGSTRVAFSPEATPIFDLTKEAKLSERSNHKFQFKASQIAKAAQAEAEYHEERLAHWREREDAARAKVEDTATVRISKHEVTGGNQYNANVDFGDREAWQELLLASEKVQSHGREAERFRSDANVYGTQYDGGDRDRVYELDSDDVHHFRLGGEPRET
jgi:hypothetical protein